MKNNLYYTPEGVRDIYNEDCERKQILERKLLNVLKTYGYHPIQTPTFEFFDVFNLEYGSRSSRDLYKFFDREGNTLVLRPDITPSIARCAATCFQEESIPLRFSYTGNTFLNNSSHQGRLKERTQLGAELIGEDSVDADAEMIALSAKLLQTAGLSRFVISIGHVRFLAGLLEAAGIEDKERETIYEFLLNRNYDALLSDMKSRDLSADLMDLFDLLTQSVSDIQILKEALSKAEAYPEIAYAIRRLIRLDELLDIYGVKRFVTYELAMISGLDYYTGIIFGGYTYGSGEAVVKGGRYDRLLSAFGKDAPSTGFVVMIDQLLAALSKQHLSIPVNRNRKWILYDAEHTRIACQEANALRERGETVELMPVTEKRTKAVYEEAAKTHGVSDLIYYL